MREVDHRGIIWYHLNDKIHREDGPAIIYPNGEQEWYINGMEYDFEDWCSELNKSDEEIFLLKIKFAI